MATLTITLPEDTTQWIECLVAKGAISDPSAYVRELVLQDWLRRNREPIDALLIEGLESGLATPMTEEDWDAIRREGLARLAADETKS